METIATSTLTPTANLPPIPPIWANKTFTWTSHVHHWVMESHTFTALAHVYETITSTRTVEELTWATTTSTHTWSLRNFVRATVTDTLTLTTTTTSHLVTTVTPTVVVTAAAAAVAPASTVTVTAPVATVTCMVRAGGGGWAGLARFATAKVVGQCLTAVLIFAVLMVASFAVGFFGFYVEELVALGRRRWEVGRPTQEEEEEGAPLAR